MYFWGEEWNLPSGLMMLVNATPALILALLIFNERPDLYGRRVGVGLLLSVVASTLMATYTHFLLGIFLFVAAHVAFAFAFLSDARRLQARRALPFAIWLLAVRAYVPSYEYLIDGPLTVFLIALGLMMWRAAARVGRKGPPTLAEWLGLAGAIAFGLTDTVIAIRRFEIRIVENDYLAVLFWVGQFAIARSALDERSPEWRRPVVNPGAIGDAPGSRRSS